VSTPTLDPVGSLGPLTTNVANPFADRSLWFRLSNGLTRYDYVRRWKRWYLISASVIIIGLIGVIALGLNRSIDFTGGTVWQVRSDTLSVAEARDAVRKFDIASEAQIQSVTSAEGRSIRVQAREASKTSESEIAAALAKAGGVKLDAVNTNFVGPSWGDEVTKKARNALVWFFIAIATYIALRFQPKMAVAALVAVVHDILVTVGVYSLTRLPVSPATVIAFLTILGYSLYDTVVVFDKVEENEAALGPTGKMSYTDIVNISMNEVMMRSLNTSFVAILPIVSLLLLGAGLLGASSLFDFGTALLVGLLTGAYSSVFIASPLLALLKEREPAWVAVRKKLGKADTLEAASAAIHGMGSTAAGNELSAAAVLSGGAPRARKLGKSR
jgi:preprotein translocase subunit SecF